MAQEEANIEIGTSEPQLGQICKEIEQMQSDCNFYFQRVQQARQWWQARWPGQTVDGRKHANAQQDCFPWDGAADSRLRMVASLIRDHVSVSKYAFFKAKIQALAVRPMIQEREADKATKLLRWRIYNHMWPEVLREVPLAFNWRWGYGVAVLNTEWIQQRRLEYHEINLQVLDEIMQAQGIDNTAMLEAFTDPTMEDALTTLVQQLSPILTRPKARQIVVSLREGETTKIPVPYIYKNTPRWRTLQPTIDLLFPSETSDIQEARCVARFDDWVTETELTDRIETENYDPAFVAEAIKQKGKFAFPMQGPADWTASGFPGSGGAPNSFRDLIQIVHFQYKTLMEGVPCLYETVFNPLCMGSRKELYAKHGPAAYDHQEYPFTVMCRREGNRPILQSVGIAEEAYTDELDIKAQQDGLTNRTSLVHSPPMIVPYSKVKAMKGERMPGAILGVSRPNEVGWMPLPPTDNTPMLVIEMVQQRLQWRYGLFGPTVDPDLKKLRRDEIGTDILGEMSLALEQVFQLEQQFEADEEVTRVVGELARPFPLDRKEIQGKYEITAVVDMQMLSEDYAEQKMALIGQAMQFNQGGTANVNALFRMAMEIIEPDAADVGLVMPEEQATQKEISDELNAIAQAFTGIEAPLPMYGNHQLRLQTLMQTTLQSPNPLMAQRLQNAPDTVEILKKRGQFFMNQIQQYTQNPQIGRALTTAAFQPRQAPQLKMPGG